MTTTRPESPNVDAEAQAILDRVGAETESPRRAEEPDAQGRQSGIGNRWSAARLWLTLAAVALLIVLVAMVFRG